MADIKTKGIEKPKVKTSGVVPKEAASIIKKKYQEQQECNAPGQKDPVRYATDKVESGGKRVARTAGDAIKQKAKKEFVKQRQQKRAQNRDTGPEQSQPQQSDPQPQPSEQVPFTESASPVPNEVGQVTEQNIPVTTQPASPPDPSLDTHMADAHSQGDTVAHSQYYGRNLSAESTHFPTTDCANSDAKAQNGGGRQNSQSRQQAQGRQKAIKDAQKSKAQKDEQQKFSTRDQAHQIESSQQRSHGGAEPSAARLNGEKASLGTRSRLESTSQAAQCRTGRATSNAPAAKEGGSRMLGKKSASKAAHAPKADGNRPKLGSVRQKRKLGIENSRIVQRQVSPAQQAKALARRKARKEMVKKAGQRTKQAATKAGKATIRFAQAVGRVALAAVKGVLAVGGGVILLIVFLCLILVAAIAASPFGIFFAGGGSQDGVPVSVAVAQVNYAYNETLEELQTAESYDDVVMEGTGADWVDVLAVFAVKVAGSNDADATDVVTLDKNRIDRLEAVFWDMNAVAHEVEEIDHPESSEGADDGYTERILHITITGKTAEEMAAEYGFTDQQLEMLQELLEEREMLADLIGSLMNVTADAKEVLLNLPEDLSPEREAVIRAACSLVGKVNYFWGGKSLVLGWDSRWGRLTEVTAAGSSTTGTYRPYGLDCSGFVDWVFYNATGGEYIIGHGGGAMMQHSYCTSISWAEAQIGDLVFYPEDTHVGIVCGWDESGNILIVHCAFSANNVVITGREGFTSIGRPVFYGGA
ncbi:C40 family peptidase [Blautia hydrogenotrophica]|jgi:hypothetical protein|nr:NlpC/P60 family protein [Blautia hydrogenotrophica]